MERLKPAIFELLIHALVIFGIMQLFGVKPREYLLWVLIAKVVLIQNDISNIKKYF